MVQHRFVNQAQQFNSALTQCDQETDRVLRLFRSGRGECENRWMDAHIKVSGPTAALRGALIGDNRNSLIGWTDKRNRDASRAAVDLLNL